MSELLTRRAAPPSGMLKVNTVLTAFCSVFMVLIVGITSEAYHELKSMHDAVLLIDVSIIDLKARVTHNEQDTLALRIEFEKFKASKP